MTTPATQALLPVTPEVTQSDVDAGWAAYDQMQDDEGNKRLRLVQAFARHRQSHSLPGDVGTAETLDDLVNKPVGGDFALRAFNVVRCLAKAEFRSEIDRCKDEAEYLMASLKDSGLPDYLRIAFPEMSATPHPSALSGDAGEGETTTTTTTKENDDA